MERQLLPWRYSLIPIYAVRYGMSIFIPLFILSVGGNVFDVGTALAIYYAVSVPASLLFGSLLDRFNRTKPFLLIGSAFTLPLMLLFLLPGSVATAWLYFALYAIVFSAIVPAVNVLIIGKGAVRKKMPKYFSKFSIFALAGLLIASFFGIAVPGTDITLYVTFLVSFSIAGIVSSMLLLKDQEVYTPKREEEHRRALTLSGILPHIGTNDFHFIRNIRIGMRKKRVKSLYQLLITLMLFNIGFYIFVGSYVPFQVAAGLTYSNVFLIQLFYAIAEICSFLFVLKLVKRPMLHRYFVSASAMIGAAYLAILLSSFMPLTFLFIVNIVAQALTGLSIAFWNLSSNVLYYHRIKGKKEGHYLGLRASLGCATAIIGSFLGGVIASTFGYVITFSFVALIIAASGIVFALELKEH